MSDTFFEQDFVHYTQVGNEFLRDKSISLRAKGLAAYMCSHSAKKYKFTIRGLASQLQEGKQAITTTLQELEKAGYMRREQVRDESGRYKGTIYRFSYTKWASQPQAGNPCTGKQDPVNSPLRKNNKRKNNIKNLPAPEAPGLTLDELQDPFEEPKVPEPKFLPSETIAAIAALYPPRKRGSVRGRIGRIINEYGGARVTRAVDEHMELLYGKDDPLAYLQGLLKWEDVPLEERPFKKMEAVEKGERQVKDEMWEKIMQYPSVMSKKN